MTRLGGSRLKSRQEFTRPEAVAEQPKDFFALPVVFFLADRLGAESLAREVAAHQIPNVFSGYVCQPETKEGLFGLEITDLQNTRDLPGSGKSHLLTALAQELVVSQTPPAERVA